MKDISLAPGLRDVLKSTMSETELQMLVTSLGILGKNGQKKRPQVSYKTVDWFDFHCSEMWINTGNRAGGLLVLLVEEDDLFLVIFAKKGASGNVSLSERNDAKEYYRKEMAKRELGHE